MILGRISKETVSRNFPAYAFEIISDWGRNSEYFSDGTTAERISNRWKLIYNYYYFRSLPYSAIQVNINSII